MFKVHSKPHDKVRVVGLKSEVCKPLATLSDGYGGVGHIIKDDYYYLFVVQHLDGTCRPAAWLPEATDALRNLG